MSNKPIVSPELREGLVAAFNEWMTQYTENPSASQHEWEVVQEFLLQKNSGVEPSYGETSVTYLLSLLEKLNATAV